MYWHFFGTCCNNLLLVRDICVIATVRSVAKSTRSASCGLFCGFFLSLDRLFLPYVLFISLLPVLHYVCFFFLVSFLFVQFNYCFFISHVYSFIVFVGDCGIFFDIYSSSVEIVLKLLSFSISVSRLQNASHVFDLRCVLPN